MSNILIYCKNGWKKLNERERCCRHAMKRARKVAEILNAVIRKKNTLTEGGTKECTWCISSLPFCFFSFFSLDFAVLHHVHVWKPFFSWKTLLFSSLDNGNEKSYYFIQRLCLTFLSLFSWRVEKLLLTLSPWSDEKLGGDWKIREPWKLPHLLQMIWMPLFLIYASKTRLLLSCNLLVINLWHLQWDSPINNHAVFKINAYYYVMCMTSYNFRLIGYGQMGSTIRFMKILIILNVLINLLIGSSYIN